jgi:hypothetical protein
LQLIWSDATRFVKVRLATILSLVITASILSAIGPVALKPVVDGPAERKRRPFRHFS